VAVVLTMSLGSRPTPRTVELALETLAKLSYQQMRRHPLPPLYSCGIRYERERNRERWQTAFETYQRKRGDCEDLAAYLCAQLWIAGEHRAHVHCYAPRPGLIHCVVRRADGRIEDPSKRLGMSGAG
jgi:hypothetical protein